jgi:hypothetical protein
VCSPLPAAPIREENDTTGVRAMSSSSWHNARNWRLRAEEIRTLADEMKDDESKSIMLRIAADYERLGVFAEKASGASPETLVRR